MEEWKNPREEQKQKGWILPSAILITGLVLAGMAGCMIAQPTFRDSAPSAVSVNPGRLREHVVMLSKTLYPRDYTHLENLDRCADYILNAFTGAGAEPDIQPFEVNSKTYRNIIGRFAVGKGSKIIIGAHYDAFGSSQGADDNASGVAGLIELAHLFGKYTPNQEIELVAYSLEEPPFFRSQRMGSAFHAKQIAESGQKISGVIVLEMIGFFFRRAWLSVLSEHPASSVLSETGKFYRSCRAIGSGRLDQTNKDWNEGNHRPAGLLYSGSGRHPRHRLFGSSQLLAVRYQRAHD